MCFFGTKDFGLTAHGRSTVEEEGLDLAFAIIMDVVAEAELNKRIPPRIVKTPGHING